LQKVSTGGHLRRDAANRGASGEKSFIRILLPLQLGPVRQREMRNAVCVAPPLPFGALGQTEDPLHRDTAIRSQSFREFSAA